jgi:hypothetical protein
LPLEKPNARWREFVARTKYYFGYLVSSAQEMKRNPKPEKKSAPPTMIITHSSKPPSGTAL